MRCGACLQPIRGVTDAGIECATVSARRCDCVPQVKESKQRLSLPQPPDVCIRMCNLHNALKQFDQFAEFTMTRCVCVPTPTVFSASLNGGRAVRGIYS